MMFGLRVYPSNCTRGAFYIIVVLRCHHWWRNAWHNRKAGFWSHQCLSWSAWLLLLFQISWGMQMLRPDLFVWEFRQRVAGVVFGVCSYCRSGSCSICKLRGTPRPMADVENSRFSRTITPVFGWYVTWCGPSLSSWQKSIELNPLAVN